MKPLGTLSPDICKKIKFLFTDIDDTLTHKGKLPSESYSAMWKLHDHGIHVVPITGRPAGWVDHFARMWPVDAVIGENGALYYRMDTGTMKRVYVMDAEERACKKKKLFEIAQSVLEKHKSLKIAADQPFREFDVAIDFAEEVQVQDPHVIQDVKHMFESGGATAKISSIHVNAWFGSFSKLTMCKQYLANEHGLEFEKEKSTLFFVGDSPNDEPLFSAFEHSAGVANIQAFQKLMKCLPAFITQKEGAYGFEELALFIISNR